MTGKTNRNLRSVGERGQSILRTHRGNPPEHGSRDGLSQLLREFLRDVFFLASKEIEQARKNFCKLARESLSFLVKAYSEATAKRLENLGIIQFRPRGEYHENNPEMSKLLHKAVQQKSDDTFELT